MSYLFNRQERRPSELGNDPHSWPLPQSFRNWGRATKSPTVIPKTTIFKDAFIPYLEVSRDRSAPALVQYPTAGQAAVQLCLIECFHNFKEHVQSAATFEDATLPTYDASEKSKELSEPTDPTAAAHRWHTAVEIAVARFKVWFEKIENTLRHASFYNRLGTSNHSRGAFTKDYLPPVDVMLVWYAYMSQPAVYRHDNLLHSTHLLLDVCMPWDAILDVINRDTFSYNLTDAAKRLFTTLTSQSADLTLYLASPPAYTNFDETKIISIDLVDAVFKLESTLERTHQYLWIRSPALEGTLERALAKYSALADVMSSSPFDWLRTVLSDPDLELIWRTHVLYPAAYATFCERAFDQSKPLDFSEAMTEKRDAMVQANQESDTCLCWICERIRDDDPNYTRPSRSHATSTAITQDLNKEQIESIKADVGFYTLVENFRITHPPGTALPTRSPTKSELAEQKLEQEKKDKAGVYYGLGWTVEVIRSAEYDEHGKLIKKEKVKVKRSSYMASAGVGSLLLI